MNQAQPFGPDRVERDGDRVIIHAARKFEEWKVREFARPPIFFEGAKYFLLGKGEAKAPFAIRYELAPWPAEDHQQSSQSFVYDLAAVRERDGEQQQEKRASTLHHLLLPLAPLLGFTWSRFKETRLAPLGLNARSITASSLMVAFALILLEGVFVGWLRGGFMGLVVHPSLRWVDWSVFLLLLIDTPLRTAQVMRDDEYPGGLLEWLLPRK